uniref:Uncharacterized protein n=1 Tax=Bosea sp. NBC_00436 TaxID=2969620 RepID=A0A9E7ZP73_9HYPH
MQDQPLFPHPGIGDPTAQVGHPVGVEGYGLRVQAVAMGTAQTADGDPVRIWVGVVLAPNPDVPPGYIGSFRTDARVGIDAEEADLYEQITDMLDWVGPQLRKFRELRGATSH